MDTLLAILQILGIAVLAVLLLILVFIAYWMLRIRRMAKAIAGMPEALRALSSVEAQPVRIHLEPWAAPRWAASERIETAAADFTRLGYARIGAFTCPEIPALRLLAFVHEAERLYAVVYEMAPAGVWLDVVIRRSDGGSLTCSNAAQLGVLDARPGHAKVNDPHHDATALHRLAIAGVALHDRAVLTAAGFADEVARAYAEEMDWRLSRGGPNEAEVRRMNAREATPAGEQAIQATLAVLRDQSRMQLDESLRARLRESGRLDAAAWERVRDRVVLVHDRLDAAEVRALIAEHIDEPPTCPDAPPRDLFRTLDRQLPADRRFRLLASLGDPLPCDAYEPPPEVAGE